jgi:hypothetical protein
MSTPALSTGVMPSLRSPPADEDDLDFGDDGGGVVLGQDTRALEGPLDRRPHLVVREVAHGGVDLGEVGPSRQASS